MKYDIVIKPEAKQDLIEARQWYENQLEGLGGEFLDEFETLSNEIIESPELYAADYRAVRSVQLV